jgi:hypothetical protein
VEGPTASRPRTWSRLAWITLALGVLPTVAGQLLAPLLAVAAWLEIRASHGRQRGRALVLAGVAASGAWCWAGGALLTREWAAFQADRAEAAASDGPCRERMLRLAEAWVQASLADPAGAGTVADADVLAWLVAQGYAEAALLHCPLDGAGAGPCSYRFAAPLPAHLWPSAQCVVLYEARPAHRRNGRRGRNAVFADQHAEFLPEDLFAPLLTRQRAAAARLRTQR